MLQTNKLYLHENCRDAAIHVMEVRDEGGPFIELTVFWWNVGTVHDPLFMNVLDNIKIKREDVSKWKEIDKSYRCPPIKHVVM